MKLLLLTCLFLTGTLPLKAQSLQELTADGRTAYLEVVMAKGAAPEAYDAAVEHLTGGEWGAWHITKNRDEADFTLRIVMEKKGMSPLSTSWGGRVHVRVEILDDSGIRWKSKKYKGAASPYTGFNAMDDAMRKIVRRALLDELRAKTSL